MEISPISSSEIEAARLDTMEISAPISSSEIEAARLDNSSSEIEAARLDTSSEMEADRLDTMEISVPISSFEIEAARLDTSSEMEADRLDTMEISAPISSSEMEAVCLGNLVGIAACYLIAGICAIQTTRLSNPIPPLVMALFKYCFFLFTFYSISGGILLGNKPNRVSTLLPLSVNISSTITLAVKFLNRLPFLSVCVSLAIRHFFPIGAYIFVILGSLFIFYQRFFHTHWLNLVRRVLDSSSLDFFTTWLQIYMSAHDQKTEVLLPWTTNAAAATGQGVGNNKKIVKTVKFAVGMTGSVLIQKYFKLNSFNEILAFLYFAVAWLANITLLSVMDDFGVFNFMIGNVVLGSTMAEAGFGLHTWLALAACLFLYRLRLELKSIPRRFNIVIFISMAILFFYGAYLVLFRYRTYILSDSRPLFDR